MQTGIFKRFFARSSIRGRGEVNRQQSVGGVSRYLLVFALLACEQPPRDVVEEAYIPARIWLLSDSQHANAIRDLLGPVDLPDVRTPGVTGDQFIHEAALHRVGGPLLSQYHTAARMAARQAALRRDQILPCSPEAIGPQACARAFIDRFAPRAFRRPVDRDERDQLMALFELGQRDGDFSSGIELVIEAILQSPGFLYRTELGAPADDADPIARHPAGVITLTPYELAAQLSFLFLDSIPDEPLWAAASDRSLSQPEVLAAHVDRLLALPRVRQHLGTVVLKWLGVDGMRMAKKDRRRLPEFDDELRESMAAETSLFVSDVLWNRGGSLRELLTSSRTFIDARLAAHYGVDSVNSTVSVSTDAVPVELDPAQRAGILTHASLLTVLGTSRARSIVYRGLFINRLFLCLPEPAPPTIELLQASAGETRGLSHRELADYRIGTDACAGCHRTIDPFGIAFENYDVLGRWQTEDIDATTSIVIPGDGQRHRINGLRDLGRVLVKSESVAACVVDQFMQRAFGRHLGNEATHSRERIKYHFLATDRSLVEIFRTIPDMPIFATRQRSERR
ncbi:MAG: DUF1592 domain-containing protein [Proteobacteria bacterium]|nr:DUF1592 domain-containing protein [Pseudomonadota bacterium]